MSKARAVSSSTLVRRYSLLPRVVVPSFPAQLLVGVDDTTAQ
jgi:hypothetical protein